MHTDFYSKGCLYRKENKLKLRIHTQAKYNDREEFHFMVLQSSPGELDLLSRSLSSFWESFFGSLIDDGV